MKLRWCHYSFPSSLFPFLEATTQKKRLSLSPWARLEKVPSLLESVPSLTLRTQSVFPLPLSVPTQVFDRAFSFHCMSNVDRPTSPWSIPSGFFPPSSVFFPSGACLPFPRSDPHSKLSLIWGTLNLSLFRLTQMIDSSTS